MSVDQHIVALLSDYLKRNQQAQVTYSTFLGFLERHFQTSAPEQTAELEPLRKDPHQGLSGVLRRLEKQKIVQLIRKDNQPLSILYPHFYSDGIEDAYDEMASSMNQPFPSEDRKDFAIPEALIQPVDVKTEFVSWLTRVPSLLADAEEDQSQASPQAAEESLPEFDASAAIRPVLRLTFPDNLPSILATHESLKEKLVVACVQKIRQYLHVSKNLSYVKQKLTPIFRGKEIPLKDMFQMILTSPDQCAKGILNATDFLFQFWTHLSTNVIKEFADKHDKLVEEQNYCQAAYLLGYYSVFFKGREQRKKDSETALKQFGAAIRKPPYAFTIQELYGLKDDKGIQFLQKFSKEQLHQHLTDQLKSPDGKSLPPLLHMTLPDSSEVFLSYDSIPLIISGNLTKVQKSFREFYLGSWQAAFLAGKKLATIEDEAKFAEHVEERLKDRHPLLYSVLRYDTLYLLSQEPATKPEVRQALLSLLSPKEQKIRSYPELLGLNHQRLLADVKILLPFWLVVPVLKNIVLFFRKIFLGSDVDKGGATQTFDHEGQDLDDKRRPGSEAAAKANGRDSKKAGQDEPAAKTMGPGASSSAAADTGSSPKAQQAAFKDAVRNIAGGFTLPGKNLDQSLKAMVDKWNPLLDGQAKKNLVEDVNSMCRDFLRGLKISYRKPPPSASDLKEMSKRLAENAAFDRIRDKESLRTYLELYFLKVLGK